MRRKREGEGKVHHRRLSQFSVDFFCSFPESGHRRIWEFSIYVFCLGLQISALRKHTHTKKKLCEFTILQPVFRDKLNQKCCKANFRQMCQKRRIQTQLLGFWYHNNVFPTSCSYRGNLLKVFQVCFLSSFFLSFSKLPLRRSRILNTAGILGLMLPGIRWILLFFTFIVMVRVDFIFTFLFFRLLWWKWMALKVEQRGVFFFFFFAYFQPSSNHETILLFSIFFKNTHTHTFI